MQSVDLDAGGRGPNGQAGSGIGGDGRSDGNNESGTEGREHLKVTNFVVKTSQVAQQKGVFG